MKTCSMRNTNDVTDGAGDTCRFVLELPERAGQADGVEDRLRFILGARAPVRLQAVAVPALGQLVEGVECDDRARVWCLVRPDEPHGRSGVLDVVPPVGGGDEHVED